MDQLGDWLYLTDLLWRQNYSQRRKNVSFNPRISFWDNIHNGSIQAGAGSFFFPDTPVDSWPVRGVQARTYLRLQTPTQRQMSGLRKQPAFLLVRSDGAPAAWLNAATPVLAAPPHRAFLNSSLLTSHCTDKWIDSGKMAEEIQPRAWKWLTFPLHPPPPPPHNKSNWLE